MGRDELARQDIWSSDWVWLKASNHKKGGTRNYRVPPFLLLKILFLRGSRYVSFNKLLSDDFSLSTNRIKASHFIILNKINIAATAMTDQLNTAIC